MMRRLPILLILALVVTVLALAPATADKPNCDLVIDPPHPSCKTDDTEPPPPPDGLFPKCDFDGLGVLVNWDRTSPFRCLWTPADPAVEFSFQLVSPKKDVSRVMLPHLIVNQDADFPSTICFNGWARNPQTLPFPQDDLWTFTPTDICTDDTPYLMTVSVKPVKTGTVDFVMVEPTP
jgi:hypothetical protein